MPFRRFDHGCALVLAAGISAWAFPVRTDAEENKPPSITSVERRTKERKKPSAGIGDIVVVTISHWPLNPKFKTDKWILYLDGIPLKGVYPLSPAPIVGKDRNAEFKFCLERNTKSKPAWTKLLRGWFGDFSRPASVAVGTEQEPENGIAPLESGFELRRVSSPELILCGIAIVALVVVIWLMAKRSNILSPGGKLSLGITQMAFWFVVVLASFLLLGIVTGDFSESISAPTLWLLGISAGTAAGAVAVDSGKHQRQQSLSARRNALQSDVATLETDANAATDANQKMAIMTELTARRIELAVVQNQLQPAAAALAAGAAARRWFHDLISDADGISFHRFQVVIWTVVLGIVFVRSVVVHLVMPEFNATLLSLMGISSGTYVGFKFPERR